MRNLESFELAGVAGGDNAEVDANLGSMIGTALHGLASEEAMIGALLCPTIGMFIGAAIHLGTKH